MTLEQRIHGLLLGTAIGDSVGLPAEGLKPAAIRKLGWDRNWKHRFLFGRGMWSDDTEHTIILAQALARCGGDPIRFQGAIRRSLMVWLLALPAGVGMATARSILKMWLCVPSTRTGVFSAGNGPAMRAGMIGVRYSSDASMRDRMNTVQTRLTHSDPKALTASRAVVELAAYMTENGATPDVETLIDLIAGQDADAEWQGIVGALAEHLDAGSSLEEYLTAIGIEPARGVSGYAYHTVPAVLFVGMQNGWEPEKTLPTIWSAGGDADTTGAIAGALCGTLHGVDAFSTAWKTGIAEWPTSPSDFPGLANAVASNLPKKIRSSLNPFIWLRNIVFLFAVLGHGFGRLRLMFPSRLRRG